MCHCVVIKAFILNDAQWIWDVEQYFQRVKVNLDTRPAGLDQITTSSNTVCIHLDWGKAQCKINTMTVNYTYWPKGKW